MLDSQGAGNCARRRHDEVFYAPRVWSGNPLGIRKTSKRSAAAKGCSTLGRLVVRPWKLSYLPVSLLVGGASVVVFLLEEADQAAALRGDGQ